jgi:hypothetical protein
MDCAHAAAKRFDLNQALPMFPAIRENNRKTFDIGRPA